MNTLCPTETSLDGLLRAAARDRTLPRAARRHVPRREYVYRCGEWDDWIYVVESGRVKTMAHTRDGKQCILSLHGPGDVFGESSVLGGPRRESVQAMHASTVIRIPGRGTAGGPGGPLREALVGPLVSRLMEQQQAIVNLVTMDSEHRLGALLMTLGRKFGTPRGRTLLIEERLTHEELADMVGTTRSRVGHFLKRFALAGAVHRTRESHLCVHRDELLDYLDAAPLRTRNEPRVGTRP